MASTYEHALDTITTAAQEAIASGEPGVALEISEECESLSIDIRHQAGDTRDTPSYLLDELLNYVETYVSPTNVQDHLWMRDRLQRLDNMIITNYSRTAPSPEPDASAASPDTPIQEGS